MRTLCFTRSRKSAELVATFARRRVAEVDRRLAGRVRAYRAGYLAEERRELEQGLVSGRLLGLATTNALELGMDVGGLDAVVLDGYPGTVASMWQQAGRAGRQGEPSLAVLVGKDDPLDAYLLHHPADLFGRPHEAALVDPTNPYMLARTCSAPPTRAPDRRRPGAVRGRRGRRPWPAPSRPRALRRQGTSCTAPAQPGRPGRHPQRAAA